VAVSAFYYLVVSGNIWYLLFCFEENGCIVIAVRVRVSKQIQCCMSIVVHTQGLGLFPSSNNCLKNVSLGIIAQ